jgi:hypothetical protein
MMDTPMAEKLRTLGKDHVRNFYIKAQAQKQLLNPQLVAEFVAWVLLETNSIDFSTKTWDVYDIEQHPNWLPEGVVPPSYNVS